jgi:adenylate kinase family enzyme
MKRISIVGNSGAGKTTLGKALAERIGAPYTELDSIYHQPGWQELPRDEFRARVQSLIEADTWVIDGNYNAVRELVWSRADTVVWFDLPRGLVMRRLIWRTLSRGITRRELWNGNRESLANFVRLDPEKSILRWAWTKHEEYRTRYAAAAQDPAYEAITFVRIGSRADAERLVADLG